MSARTGIFPATVLVCCLLITPSLALAEDRLSQENANILWTLIGGMLVMFMQPGLRLSGMWSDSGEECGQYYDEKLC